jgi:hypothetical protein
MTAFTRAARRRAFIKIALTGPSGSGKTYSALQLAFGLGARVALLDTENGSGSLYADLGAYDTAELRAPFTVASYEQAIREAAAAGYDVLIIDSLSHAWAGEGGLLAQKEALDARGGNSFTNWATITKQHEALKSALLQAPIHVIATMRSKTEYVVDQSDGRKATPRKVGLAPIQRDGMEYEFTTVFDLAADHTAIAGKDRTGLFAGLNAKLTPDHGRALASWLDAAPVAPAPRTEHPAPSTPLPAPEKRLSRLKAEDRMRALLLDAHDAGLLETLQSAQELAALDISGCPDADLAAAIRELESALAVLRTGQEETAPSQRPTPNAQHPTPNTQGPPPRACLECGAPMTAAQFALSNQKFGQPLCPRHQPERKAA